MTLKTGFSVLSLMPTLALATIHYVVQPDPGGQKINVTIRVDKSGPNTAFRIPAWCPGFYTLKNYQEKISDVRFVDGQGKAVEFKRPDPRVWQAANTGGPLTMTYSVLGDDGGLGFFGVNVRSHTAFINGPAAFMYADGRKGEAITLEVKKPAAWDEAVALDKNAQGYYTAGDYDELLDSPIRLGKFERRKFTVEGIPFEAIFASTNQNYNPDLDAQARMLSQVSIPAIKLFGKAPFKRYIYFINLAIGDFGGGLEHRASTVMAMPNTKALDLITLASHEYFHAWNVKQIRPEVLGPFDYTQPVRTANLWFAEGVTDYYADLLAYRSGLLDQRWYLRSLAGNISELQRSNTRKQMTLEDVCRQTWEHSGFDVGDLSYYTKGLVVGAVFDAAIREATQGKKSLDDVMRLMFTRYRLPQPGYAEDAIRTTINEVAVKDLSDLYEVMLRSTKEVPYERLAGVGLRVVPPNREVSTLGATLEGSKVAAIEDGSPWQVGDEIINVDGKPFSLGAFYQQNAKYEVDVKRGDKVEQIQVPLTKRTVGRWIVEPDPFATLEQAKRRSEFLAR
ncbi:MAG: hypothetical protein K1X67_21680 [Fimbriimonadaceae bacterium]|nr:hypothetical protein [Fimbriimonadaceae bacterium]